MKKLLSATILVLAGCLFLFGSPAFAGDATAGAAIFSANCAACHIGGGNVVNGDKTLKIEALTKYEKNTEQAIINQATNGAGAMPSFKRLGEEAIANVAAYVLEQAEGGWK